MTDIIQNFDVSVAGYEIYCSPQDALATSLAKWIPFEERNGYAVEFGAGTGLFTRKLQPWCGAYLATDASAQMVATGIQNCSIVAWKQHAANDRQGLGEADWVLACNVLQWLENPAEVLAAWRSILKPGGHLVVAALLPGTLRELRQILPEANPLAWHTAEEWLQMTEQAGFVLEQTEVWEHTEVFPSALDMLHAIHAMGLAPCRLTGPGRLRTALREYDRQFSVPGGVASTWQAWLARAVKA